MKIILTGATGWIGGGVLKRCLALQHITEVVALTRRPMDDVKDPKLENIVHKDFMTYDEDTISKLKGADACIWSVARPYAIDQWQGN
jgi:uncharacterized protein YbjT (DUF2867 family)